MKQQQQQQQQSSSPNTSKTMPSSSAMLSLATAILLTSNNAALAFVPPSTQCNTYQHSPEFQHSNNVIPQPLSSSNNIKHNHKRNPNPTTSTALSVWWFGGTPSATETTDPSDDQCELVAVRIDRTSSNSRRISGDIVVNAPLMDVWAILTDYDNLSTHVPNLVASRETTKGLKKNNNNNNANNNNYNNGNGSDGGKGVAGDGSYKCRLYQRGAQKIVGFEFGADVTMDMTELIVADGNSGIHAKSHELSSGDSSSSSATAKTTAAKSTKTKTTTATTTTTTTTPFVPQERHIQFKCVDSQFFSEFDGTWKVISMPNNPYTNQVETTVSYTVDVRPKGPVPVAALEWRIREDVPTNLRAVKRAATEVGRKVLRKRGLLLLGKNNNGHYNNGEYDNDGDGDGVNGREEYDGFEGEGGLDGFADFILDYENETLGAYLKK